jgi:trk system potassium uptake protein TrkA
MRAGFPTSLARVSLDSMHLVIMGCGRVGAELTVQLSKAGHTVSIVDKRKEAFERLPPGFNAKTIVGIGFDREVLEEAGIKEADAFIAVSNGDNSNIVSARIAREHYHVEKVIARIYDPRRAEIYERLNIPTITSVKWAAAQIQFLLFHGKEELKESFAGGELLHLQREVPEHLVGKPVASVEQKGAISVMGVDRGGQGFIPVDGSTFQGGDIAHLVVTAQSVGALDELFQRTAE